MSQKGKQIVAVAVIIIALGFAISGYILLPDTLVMQITASGSAGTTMPKLLGLAIPLVLSVGIASYYLMTLKSNGKDKPLWISLVGIVVFILTFAFNIKL